MLLMKQFTIRGSIEYPADYQQTIDLLTRHDLSPLITHRFPLDRFHDGLALLDGSDVAGRDCGKVLITMGADR